VDERPLTFSFEPETRTLFVSGEVDELSGIAFRETIEKHSEAFTRPVVIDLSDVDFLPSLGVGVLAVALRNADEKGTRMELVADKGTIAQQVLNICGLPHRTS
jgi:anti-anti-sigma factor